MSLGHSSLEQEPAQQTAIRIASLHSSTSSRAASICSSPCGVIPTAT